MRSSEFHWHSGYHNFKIRSNFRICQEPGNHDFKIRGIFEIYWQLSSYDFKMGKSFKFKFQKPGNQNVKTIDDEFYQHTGKPSFKVKGTFKYN